MLVRLGLPLVALSLASVTPASAVVAISGSASINASASVQGVGNDADSQSAPLTGFGGRTEINAVAGVGGGGNGVYVFGRTYNYWSVPEYGMLEFTRHITLIAVNRQGRHLHGFAPQQRQRRVDHSARQRFARDVQLDGGGGLCP